MDFNRLPQYEVIKEKNIKDLKSQGTLLRHKKSGARILVLENDDDNKVFYIGFRTPPKDSTGVAHIMEHSVLCGSRKYPLKDPFVELVKGSMNTFLNAMTYPDKTVYPVASCNDKDFENLMNVYLDAVFYPNIYREKKIFMQEGWHYEMEDASDELKYNGVVYNEMKGVFASPDNIHDSAILNSLLPETCYFVESGGDPDYIPDLTYEDFLNFHDTYYSPANSYIYLYGNCDMTERLIWMDENYLKDFDIIDVDSHPGKQEPFDKAKYVTAEYPLGDDENDKNATYLSYNCVIGDTMDREKSMALDIISFALIDEQGTPLRQALLDSGISTDVYSMYENQICQPLFSIVAKNCNPEDMDRFESIVTDTLKKVCDKGLDRNAIEACISSMEFRYREADYGHTPKGLIVGLNAFKTWLYDDNEPFTCIEVNGLFDKMREYMNTDYFERIIREDILENNHKVVLKLVPSKGLNTRKDKELKKKLEEYKKSLTADQIDDIVTDTRNLKAYQSAPESKAALDTIPKLTKEDLPQTPRKYNNDMSRLGERNLLWHDVYTNEIAYYRVLFEVTDLPKEYLPYLGLLSDLLGYVDTDNYTYEQLAYSINKYAGGIASAIKLVPNMNDESNYHIFLSLSCKTLYSNLAKTRELVEEIILRSHLDDKKRIHEIIAENRSCKASNLVESGHLTAALRAGSYIYEPLFKAEQYEGIDFYHFLVDSDVNFDSKADDILDKLSTLSGYVFCRDNISYDLTSDKEGNDLFRREYKDFDKLFAESTVRFEREEFVPEYKNEAFTIPGMINYNAVSGSHKKAGLEYTGALSVLKKILGYDYLWNEVRVKGGAYGCMNSINAVNHSEFMSYRDPNLAATYEVYKNVVNYVKNFKADESEMTKYIIGTMSDISAPLTPRMQGDNAFSEYYGDNSYENRLKVHKETLNTTVEDIRALWPYVKAIAESPAHCTIGNENMIKENKEMFKSVSPCVIN